MIHRPAGPLRQCFINPLVAEMADATVSEAVAARHARSTRAEGTIPHHPPAFMAQENIMKNPIHPDHDFSF